MTGALNCTRSNALNVSARSWSVVLAMAAPPQGRRSIPPPTHPDARWRRLHCVVSLNPRTKRKNSVVSSKVLDLHRALEALAREDAGLAQVVEMHYFGGMTAEEVALADRRSVHVIRHELRFSRAWLRRALAG